MVGGLEEEQMVLNRFGICDSVVVFFFSSRRRHTRWNCDWSSDVCSSDLIFVFISGYTAVIAYSRMMLKEGWFRAAARIYRRVWQLYVAHILLFVAFTAQIAWVSFAHDTSSLIEELQLLGLGQDPFRAILEAALLKFRPTNLDVLPLYIALLAAFPLVLPALVRWPLSVIAVSLALYAATCHFDWNLPGYPDPKVWFFNPMAWQVVFYTGAGLAVLGPKLVWLDR